MCVSPLAFHCHRAEASSSCTTENKQTGLTVHVTGHNWTHFEKDLLFDQITGIGNKMFV